MKCVIVTAIIAFVSSSLLEEDLLSSDFAELLLDFSLELDCFTELLLDVAELLLDPSLELRMTFELLDCFAELLLDCATELLLDSSLELRITFCDELLDVAELDEDFAEFDEDETSSIDATTLILPVTVFVSP